MTTETWRVACEGGEVRDVRVTKVHRQWEAVPAVLAGDAWQASTASARRAVVILAATEMWPVREILAPGELSAEERVAAERARCLAACRAVAAREAGYGNGVARDAARLCAEAIERGAVER